MIFIAIIAGFAALWTYCACVVAGKADQREEEMFKDYFESKNKNDDISID